MLFKTFIVHQNAIVKKYKLFYNNIAKIQITVWIVMILKNIITKELVNANVYQIFVILAFILIWTVVYVLKYDN